MSSATERKYTVDQVAADPRVRCNPETIRRAIRSGELKASRNRLAAGQPYVIGEAELRGFVAKRTA